MIISLKVLEFDQNAIGMNTAKSQQSFIWILKSNGYQNQIRKRIFDAKERDEHVDVIDKFLCAITNLRLATAIK